MANKGPAVIVHGGAWAIPNELVEASVAGVQRAAKAAWEILKNGGSALDAVEAAVIILEDDPAFDAGTGSVLTFENTVEMDAIIMSGEHLQVGAVACVENIKNPIKLARQVMERTDHVLLVGQGANKFAAEIGIPTVTTESLVTPEAVKSLEAHNKYRGAVTSYFSERQDNNFVPGHDTVGCVALDKCGHLASANSTGGITSKRPGRVGDSPLIGGGAYADDGSCAVSCTGHGESIAKVCLARRVAERVERGLNPQRALEESLDFMSKRLGKAGGAIAINKMGECGFYFNTERMPWCCISSETNLIHYGIDPCESRTICETDTECPSIK